MAEPTRRAMDAAIRSLRSAVELIDEIEEKDKNNELTAKLLGGYQKKYEVIAKKYINAEYLGSDRFVIHELNALIQLNKGNSDGAGISLIRAASMKPLNQPFISTTGQRYESYLKADVIEEKQKKYKKPFFRRKWVWLVIAYFVVSFAYEPVSEYYMFANADPTIRALAERAGMNHQGEKILLQSKAEVIDRYAVAAACETGTDDSVEQGCFYNGRIAIADMPVEFDELEPVIAAHEMLHAADMHDEAIYSLLKSYALTLNDAELNERLALYEKSQAGSSPGELHSIIGTEYANLPEELEVYYSQFFENRNAVVFANNNVNAIFKNLEEQITDISSKVNQGIADSKTYYNRHSFAARNGNSYNYDYYWNLYTAKVDEVNKMIDTGNMMVDRYNSLAAKYSGKVFTLPEALTLPTQ